MSNAPATFSDTGETVRVQVAGVWKECPVFKLGKRLYAGEFLTTLNPHGYGGAVWAARDIKQLQYNIDFNARRDRGDRH